MDQHRTPHEHDRGPWEPEESSGPGRPTPPQNPYGAYGAPPTPPNAYGAYGAPPPGYGSPARRPGVIPLTPLALGDLLGGSFAVIRRNPAAVMGTALIVALIEIVISVAATAVLFRAVSEALVLDQAGASATLDDTVALGLLGALSGTVAITVVGALLASLVGIVAQGVLAVVVLRSAAGLTTSLGQAWRLTGRQVWSLIGLGLVYLAGGLVVFLLFGAVITGLVVAAVAEDGTLAGVMGILLFVLTVASVVLGLWIYVKLLLSASASAVELASPFRAIGRSWTLTRGHWWRTFGIILLVAIIIGVVSSVITTPLSLAGGVFAPFSESATPEEIMGGSQVWLMVNAAATALVGALATVYTACLVSLLYTDYRIRQESFDLELAAAADAAGLGDDERFSTVRDVQVAAGTDTLVPGRPTAAHSGPADPAGR